MRLSLENLPQVAAGAARPAYEPERLGTGIVHLGVGAFHRAHQAVYTEDAIEAAGGAWGIAAISMRQPTVAATLAEQDGLYTVEQVSDKSAYRIIGALRSALTLPLQPAAVLAALAAPSTHIVTLTVTEKGYCLGGDGLDFAHPDIVDDLAAPHLPHSAIGALVSGLEQRWGNRTGPLTVISCDNLTNNGPRLRDAAIALAGRRDRKLAAWIEREIAFPETMVDSIVPASDAASLTRVKQTLGMEDRAAVQREVFAQWVIEDKFSGPRPAWDKAGAEIVAAVQPFRQLKLHVLNAPHSALAYLGLARGHEYVRQAIADPALAGFLESLIAEEVAPGLPSLAVAGYWAVTRTRFANPAIDHRLDQIAQDGPFKLAQRVFPLMISNLRAGVPFNRLGAIVRGWLTHAGLDIDAALADPALFPDDFRREEALRRAIKQEIR
jgi:fructuronate reductase